MLYCFSSAKHAISGRSNISCIPLRRVLHTCGVLQAGLGAGSASSLLSANVTTGVLAGNDLGENYTMEFIAWEQGIAPCAWVLDLSCLRPLLPTPEDLQQRGVAAIASVLLTSCSWNVVCHIKALASPLKCLG